MADSQRKTANLFDYQSVAIGKYIDANGVEQTSASLGHEILNHSNTINITPNTSYSFKIRKMIGESAVTNAFCWFDENMTIISRNMADFSTGDNYIEMTFTSPANATYLIINFRDNYYNTGMCNTGSQPLPYEPYGWLHSLRKLGTSTDTITILPADLYADGNNATVGILGNMQQTGTPTPQNPIQPQECGERTANLFDESNGSYNAYVDDAGTWRYVDTAKSVKILCLANTTYTLSAPENLSVFRIYEISDALAEPPTQAAEIVRSGGIDRYTFTTASTTAAIIFQGSAGNFDEWFNGLMLNLGSTALPYEPYGVKIPISSASTTTPVYLGEVESTRKIKKYEFTGQEAWVIGNYPKPDTYQFYIPKNVYFPDAKSTIASGESFCTHFLNRETAGGTAWGTNFNIYMLISDLPEGATANDFKAYLAAQYAAGTPVTIWYPLANETTGIVNEPIRKIGDYADTVSGISIPTVTGKDTFDVQTTLKPSEVELTYTGWHDASVGEWDGSDWQ